MERDSAEYVNNYCSLRVPIETWMVEVKAKHIFHRKNHKKYLTEAHIAINGDEDVSYPLKISNHWVMNFLGLLHCKIGTKMNKKAATKARIAAITDYNISIHDLHLSEINNPVHGFYITVLCNFTRSSAY